MAKYLDLIVGKKLKIYKYNKVGEYPKKRYSLKPKED